jgi:hypothetical protein
MTNDERIEAVARAIYTAMPMTGFRKGTTWDHMTQHEREPYRDAARKANTAALQSLLEPSEAMVCAAEVAFFMHFAEKDSGKHDPMPAVIRNTIQAAIKEAQT